MNQTDRKEISDYIAAQILKQPGREIANDDALISSGLVDSFSLVDLSIFIEEKFGVHIEDTELNADSFDTLDELAALIQNKKF